MQTHRTTKVIAWSDDGAQLLIEERWQACTDEGLTYRLIGALGEASFAFDRGEEAGACLERLETLRKALGGFAGLTFEARCSEDLKSLVTVDEAQQRRVDASQVEVDSTSWNKGRIVVKWDGRQRLAVKRPEGWNFHAWAAASARVVALFHGDDGFLMAWTIEGNKATEIRRQNP